MRLDNLAQQVYYYAILEWLAYVSSNHETTKLFKALIEEFTISQTINFQSILRQYQICFCAGANLEYMRRHL